jgi:hypothetical protein
VVLFAHGSGSSRHSPRNRFVARELQRSGLATVVIELNRKAMQELSGEARLEIVTGASHLFEEPGALEQVARLAQGWFSQHLKPGSRERHPGGTSSSARRW